MSCKYFVQHYAMADDWTMVYKIFYGHCSKSIRSKLKENCKNYEFSQQVVDNAKLFNVCVEIRNKLIHIEKVMDEVYDMANIIK